jgi:hypothetical protein
LTGSHAGKIDVMTSRTVVRLFRLPIHLIGFSPLPVDDIQRTGISLINIAFDE